MGGLCSICAEPNPAFAQAGNLDDSSEKSISFAEKKSPISKKPSFAIKSALKNEVTKGKLTMIQLKKAVGSLGIDKNELQNPDNATYIFLHSLGNDSDADELLVLSAFVLISNSAPKEKASVFFEAYDTGSSKLLGKNDIERMLRDFYEVSVKHLPLLAIGSSKMIGDGINAYLGKINCFSDQFVNDFTHAILKGNSEIGLNPFVTVFQNELSALMSSSGIRTEVFKKYGSKI